MLNNLKVLKSLCLSHSVVVSTRDFKSHDPSSNLGGTDFFFIFLYKFINN